MALEFLIYQSWGYAVHPMTSSKCLPQLFDHVFILSSRDRLWSVFGYIWGKSELSQAIKQFHKSILKIFTTYWEILPKAIGNMWYMRICQINILINLFFRFPEVYSCMKSSWTKILGLYYHRCSQSTALVKI